MFGTPVDNLHARFRNADEKTKEKINLTIWEKIRDFRTWKNIPIIGKFWYWHIGYAANRKYKEESAELKKIAQKNKIWDQSIHDEYVKYQEKLYERGQITVDTFLRRKRRFPN